MIIVDGPDGSGKTTLIEQLGYERRSLKSLYGGIGAGEQGDWGGGDEALIAYARQILHAEEAERVNPPGSDAYGTRIAFDRFHLSEVVYGPLLRGASGITHEEVIVLRRLLRARGIPVIVCMPPWPTTLSNVNQEGRSIPSYQTAKFLEQAYLGWQGLLATHLDLIRYDYTTGPVTCAFPREPILLPRCPLGVIGSPTAKILIVGERSTLPLDLPFFSMEGSSGYLNRSLWDAGLDERDLAFANAYRELPFLSHDLGGVVWAMRDTLQVIIPLGNRATELVDRYKFRLPVRSASHPQYWRRFHPHQRGAYVEQLRQAAAL